MATISENLEALKTAKASIKSAIEGKGQSLTDVPFTQYGEKIEAIQTGGSGECISNVDYVKQMDLFSDINGDVVISDADYSDEEIQRLEEILINLTEGNNG